MSREQIRVAALASTPIKGLRVTARPWVLLERGGVRSDRSLFLVDERGRMVNGKHLGALNSLTAEIDARRFRMSLELGGAEAHEEDRWVGREITVGEARILVEGHVGRCIVTSRHPESGEVDLPTLELLREYRDGAPTTEPLAFGVYGAVLREGVVRIGDAVELAES
jgi:uncharacterized protein YcbX